jgi:hypothetical protein
VRARRRHGAQGPVSLGSGFGLRVFSLRGCRAVQDGCGAQVTGGEGVVDERCGSG